MKSPAPDPNTTMETGRPRSLRAATVPFEEESTRTFCMGSDVNPGQRKAGGHVSFEPQGWPALSGWKP
jgi:hypothetical protein